MVTVFVAFALLASNANSHDADDVPTFATVQQTTILQKNVV